MNSAQPVWGTRGSRILFFAAIAAAFSSNSAHAQSSYQDIILADAPFAYWRLDETTGSSATNLGNSDVESASYAGPVELGVPGLADPDNPAVRFTGYDDVDAVGAKVDIADSPLTNAGGPYTEKTIELWFSADNAGTLDEQVLYEQGGSTRGMAMYIRDGQVYVGAHNSADDDGSVSSPWPGGTGGDRELAFVSAPIESNTPYHLAMVFQGDADGFDGTITGYLNGESMGEVGGIGSLFGHTDDIAIGGVRAQTLFDNGLLGDDAPDIRFFEGVVDEVALYDRALTEGRIGVHLGADLSADINGDGTVDLADFQVLAGNFNGPGEFADGDINFDLVVDMNDFVAWRELFQPAQGAAAAAVPEPSTGLLLPCGLLLGCVARKKRHA